jgi:hypothetical protein
MRVAVGEGVEAGAENGILRDALLDGFRQLVFGIPAPCRHKRAKGASNRVLAFVRTGAQFLRGVGPDYRQGQGTVEDFGLLKKLVGGAANCDLSTRSG